MRSLVVDMNNPHGRQRGQVLVIFAGSLIALMMLSALVVDIGWYWSNGLKLQRAADAAALAGAVYLPDNFNITVPNAQTAALAAAKRNGYVPDADTTLTSSVDPNNPRQLDVTITDKVGTFFMKVAGIQTLDAARSSKAEFIMPVPMGSPQNYYGLGTFLTRVPSFVNPAGFVASSPTTGAAPAGNTTANTSGGGWNNPNRTGASDASFATSSTNLNQDAWKTFTFGAFQGGAIIDGVVVNLQAKVGTAATACQINTEVSWNGGATWGSKAKTTANLTGALAWYVMGSQTDPSAWDATHTSWATTDFTTADRFQVRLTYLKGAGCGTVSLDEITAVVYSHTVASPGETVQPVPDPLGPALASQGFWGADITKGGSRENGDQFGPANDNLKSMANPNFDGKGVDYTVVIAGTNGQVQLFDPTFCATGQNSVGGNFGTGDHWIFGTPSASPVTTVYSLFDQHGTPFDITDDIPKADSGTLFNDKIQADYSGTFGSPPTGLTDCRNDPYHNKWYQLASGLPAGTYRLNVTTNVAGNDNTNAENMWSAWVSSSSAGSQVFGQGKMVTYNNLLAGTQLFYLAQIDKVHASKTMEIKLFDPGDVKGNAYLSIKSPDGNAYNYVDFTYTADNGRSGASSGPTKSIQTAAAPNTSYFQDALITIEIPLPSTYGSVGLTPLGEPGAGWWKIEYSVDGGNDTTTWQVDIKGNPVHLLVP